MEIKLEKLIPALFVIALAALTFNKIMMIFLGEI